MANISFDANYYYEQKLNELQSTDSEQYADWTVADVALSFNENGLTPEEHYAKYGVGEGLNPSAEFDTQAYLSAKLGLLQEQDSEQYADWTVEDVAQAFEDNGLSPLEHFNQYGQDEGLEATPAGATTPSELTEALNAYDAAQEGLEVSADSYATVLAEAGGFGVTANDDGTFTGFDPENNDYVAQAESDVQTALGSLANARAAAPDAAVNTAVTQAQAAVNAYDERFDEAGSVSSTSTTYTLAQLQARATNAQAAFEANVESNGDTADLAQSLSDELALYLNNNPDLDPAGDGSVTPLQTLQAAITTYENGGTEADFLDAVATAQDQIFSGTDDASVLVDGSLGDAVESSVTTLDERNTLSDAADDGQTAFESAEDTAITNDNIFADVDFVDSADDLTSAEAVQETRQDLIDALSEAQETQADVESAGQDYSAAQQEVTDATEALGFDVQDVDSSSLLATDDADLFIFDAEAADDAGLTDIAINGFESDDALYLGSDYSVGTEGSADNNTLEVFLSENGGNAVLQIENSAYGSVSDDFTEITLTGVAQSDVSIDNGVVSIA